MGFDSAPRRAYYTRPMAADWSRAVEVGRLADAGERLDFDARPAEFPRLVRELAAATGRVQGHLQFARERGQAVVELRLRAVLPLVCQRCLGPVDVEVGSDVRVALVDDLDEADRLDAGIEPVVVEGGRVSPRDLVEEELLLAVPLVPRHEDESKCGTRAAAEAAPGLPRAVPADRPAQVETQKPFAGLGELLKRGP